MRHAHPTGGAVLLLFFALALVTLLPVAIVSLPPIVDYPNHLARMWILAASGSSGLLDQFYAIRWSLLPNLAMDLIVPPLIPLLGVDLAGRVFLGLVLILIPSGALTLHRALYGRWSYWPLAAFFLLYGRPLLWGFLNYLFGVGLALHGLALWVALAGRPRARVLVTALVALATYVAHVEAFALFALALTGLETGAAIMALRKGDTMAVLRRVGSVGIVLLAPLLLFVLTWHPAAGGGAKFGNPWRKLDIPFGVVDAYQQPFDIACFAAGLGLIAFLTWRRRLSLLPGTGWALILVLVFYLGLPAQALSGSAADHRVPIFLFLLLIAGTAPRWPSRRVAAAIGFLSLILFCLRIGLVAQVWRAADQDYVADLAAIDSLPAGSRIAVAAPPDTVRVARVPLLHLPVIAVARRDAFVTTLFASPDQQPVTLRQPYEALAKEANPARLWQGLAEGNAAVRAGLAPILAQLDIIAFVSPRPIAIADPSCLTPLFQGARFHLWAILHEACS